MLRGDLMMLTKVRGADARSPSRDGSLGSCRSSARFRASYRRPLRLSWAQTLQLFHVPPIVAVIFVWRFEDKRLLAQLGMSQNAAETGGADVSFTDVGVPVHVRSQRRFGIVGVDDFHIRNPQNAVGFGHGLLQACFARHVESGGQQVARVQAITDFQVSLTLRQLTDGLQFIQAAPNL